MLEFIRTHLSEIESGKSIHSLNEACAALRPLGLSDFGSVLWGAPLKEFPALSRHLPKMSSAEVQRKWTGFTGERLLDQSVSFVRSASENYLALTGQSLHGKRILDYGCGYGRFLRLFRYYSDQVWGVDAWEESLAESCASGFGDFVRKIDTIPEALPDDIVFDFAFAFSIFTHLNERAATAALTAMRKSSAEGAVLCITIRPVEYWHSRFREAGARQEQMVETAMRRHARNGFAFAPSGKRASDPEGVFGHASIDLKWLERHAAGWRVSAIDRSVNDAMQRYVYLTAV